MSIPCHSEELAKFFRIQHAIALGKVARVGIAERRIWLVETVDFSGGSNRPNPGIHSTFHFFFPTSPNTLELVTNEN
jgi:hypothetical protein